MSFDRPHQPRIDNVRRAMIARHYPIDALLVTSLPNIFYLSGFTGSAAAILITQSDAILITDGRYTVQARKQCPDYRLTIADGSGGYTKAIQDTVRTFDGLSTLGFDDTDMSVQRLRDLRKMPRNPMHWTPAGGLVEGLRLIKDDTEIALMRDAIAVAQEAFESVRSYLKPGVKERDYAIELEFAMRRLGADGPSFDTIVAGGPNGALPHYHAGEREFEAGDLVTVDWGAHLKGYCSDITRTVVILGKPVDDKLREIYNIVQHAKIAAVKACKAGALGKNVDSVARDIIAAAGYGPQFSHSLGHSLGIITHDGVTLSQRAVKVKLQAGVVTTVEPGIYVEGLGGVRIEEDILVTEKGPVVLTQPDDAFI